MEKTTAIKDTELKVLVLEDSHRDLELMREQLSTEGFRLDVTHVDDEAGYTASLRKNRFDLILADFKLPDFDAFGALEISRELSPETPFICLSGTIGEETAVELLKLGAVDYVLKDKPEKLPFAVKRALKEAEVKAEYQKTAQTLKESEDRLSKIMLAANDGTWDWDLRTNQVYFDPRYYQMSGYDVNEFPHKLEEFQKRIHPDDIDYVMSEAEKHLKGEIDHFDVQFRFRKKTDEWQWIQGKGIIVERNEKGVPQRFVGTHRDISERKQAEEALRKNEAKFRSYINNAPDGIFITDEKGKYIEVNQAACEITGYTETVLLKMHIPDLLQKSEIDKGIEHFQRVKEKGAARSEIGFITKSGENRFWNVAAVKLSDSRFLGFVKDITVRRQAEEALRLSEKQNAFLVQTAFELVELDSIQEIYKYTVQKLYELFEGNSIVALVEYNYSENRWKMKHTEGIDKNTAERSRLLGFDIDALEGDIATKYIEKIISSKVAELEFDFPGLFNNKLSAAKGSVIKKMFSIEKMYCIAFQQDEQIIGNITFTTNKKSVPVNTQLIEAFIQQVSNFVKKQKAEERLKESEHFYKATFEEAAVGIAHVLPNGDFFKVNKKFCEITGYAAAELNQMNIKDISFPEDIEKENEYIREVLANKRGSYIIEKRYHHKQGHYIWVKLHSNVIRNNNGEIEFAIASISDITQSKQAEEALRKNRRDLQALISNSPICTKIIDPDFNLQFMSEAGIAQLKIDTIKEFYGKPYPLSFFPDSFKKEMSEKLKESKNTAKTIEIEGELADTKGNRLWYNHILAPVKDDMGNMEYILVVSMDLTKRKQAEAALRQSEEMIISSQAVAHICSYSTNLNVDEIGKSQWVCSPEFYKIFGIDESYPHTIAGWANFIHPDYRQEIFAYHESVVKEKKSFNREYKIIRVIDGAERWVHGTGELEFDKKGKPVRMYGAIQDITERKQAEKALLESEERFKKLSSFTFEGIIIHKNAIAIDVNQSIQKMLGYERAEIIGMNLFQLIHPDDHEVTKANLSKQVASPYQMRVIRKDGSMFYAEVEARNISYNNDFFRVACIRDITERKRAEKIRQLQYNIARAMISTRNLNELFDSVKVELNKLIDAKNFVVAFYNEETGMLNSLVNKDEKDDIGIWPAKKSLTGYTIEQNRPVLLQKNEILRLHNEGIIDLIGTVSEAWLGVPLKIEGKILGAVVVQNFDNRDAYNETSIEIMELAAHELSLFIDRQLTEEKAWKLSRAIEQSPVSVIITNRKGLIEYTNPFFTELTGYRFEEVKGKNPNIFRSGHHTTAFYKDFWDTILLGHNWEGEFLNKKKNGELYWANAVVAPIVNSDGVITNFVSIKEDITQRKKMIEELVVAKEKAQESDKLKSAFLANMSHEIRTPMNGILGFLELLQEPDLEEKEKTDYINIVNKSGERLLSTINDIIEISKIESGDIQITRQEIKLLPFLSHYHGFFLSQAKEKGLQLKIVHCKNAPATIYADKTKLHSILSNLIKNAIKFTDHGSVEFGCNLHTDNDLRFYVKDTGKGIDPEKQNTVFGRFVRADISLSSGYEGAGLGLSITKGYVEALGGSIWIESEPGKGSCFYFTIPVVKEKQKQ